MLPRLDVSGYELRSGARLDMTLLPGSYVGVIGARDSGITELMADLAGLRPARARILLDGRPLSELPGRQIAKCVAYVPSDAGLLFSGVMRTVRGEIAFSLEMLGEAPADCDAAVRAVVEAFDLRHLLDRDPFTLSGGERARAALALVAVKGPTLWVIDNVHGSLDAATEARVRHWLDRRRTDDGVAVVEFHSVAPSWSEEFTSSVFLTRTQVLAGQIASVCTAVAEREPTLLPPLHQLAWDLSRARGVSVSGCPTPGTLAAALGSGAEDLLAPRVPAVSDASALEVADLTFRHERRSAFRLGPLALTVRGGELAALVGPNGAGKTTLLKLIAGLLDADEGTIIIQGPGGTRHSVPPARHRHHWASLVQYAFQNPDDHLYHATVRRELEDAARRSRHHDADAHVEQLAHVLGFADFLSKAPHDLPRPLRRMVSLACSLATNPTVLLIDEPTAGLDGDLKQSLEKALAEYLAGGGAALMVSHDMEFVAATTHRRIALDEGRVSASFGPADWLLGWPAEAEPARVLVAKRRATL